MKLLRKRLVIVRQHDETDCGAACLATIAKYYGKEVSISRIRYFSGTDCFGTSGYGIVKGAEFLGMSCRGMISAERRLDEDVPLPVICHIKKSVLDHYVVVYGLQGKKVIVADPAEGISRMDINSFRKVWTGIYFMVMPEQRFTRTKETKGVFARFAYLLKPYKRTVGECFVAGMLLSFLGAASAFYFRFLIDDILYSSLKNTLTLCSLAYVLVLLFRVITEFVRSQLMNYMCNKIDLQLVTDYFRHLLFLPLNFFSSRKTGEISSRIGDAATVRNTISSATLSIILDCCMLVTGGIFLFGFGSKLIPVSLVPVVLSAALVWSFLKPFQKKIKELCCLEADKQSAFVETINGIATVKAISSEKEAYRRVEEKVVSCTEKSIGLGTMSNIIGTVQRLITDGGNLALYWFGSLLILKGELSLGQLISFVTLSGYFLGPLERLMTLQQSLQEAYIASDRLSEVLDMPEEGEEEKSVTGETEEFKGLKDKIEVRNLNFSYGTRGAALTDVNLTIRKGQHVAFVGASGSGKSTMTKLLMKFYSGEKGAITVDGKNLKDIETHSYRKSMGYVPQEVLLFSGTIYENINYGTSGYSPDEVVQAAKRAHAHQFIEKMDCQYRTLVGERGASLSGGERQRISLARVLLRKPEIMILDEATSSLDSISEKEIMDAINSECSGCTLIMVAHRLSTIVNCDVIYVFDGGKVVESGTHMELLKKGGLYSRMWDAQQH